MKEGNATYLSNSSYAKECCKEAKKIAVQNNDSLAIVRADYCIARSILIKGDVERALSMLNTCISYFEINNLKIDQGDALALKALSLRRIEDTKGGVLTLKEAIQIFEEANDRFRLMKCLINISLDYMDDKNYKEAYNNLSRAEKINKEVKDRVNAFYIQLNLGQYYLETGDKPKAIRYLNSSFEIATQEKMVDALTTNLIMLGKTYIEIERYDMAILKFLVAVYKSAEFDLPNERLEALHELNKVYRKVGDFENSLKYFEQYVMLKDSMYSVERLARIDHLEKQLDVEEKENQLALNKLELIEQTVQISKQKNQKYLFAGALSIVFIIMLVVYKGLKDKKKANEIITFQKREVEEKKDEIEEKNKEIIDSINYAQRIQQALLKSEEKITEILPPHFILFKPKDIVSGDFYWAYEKQVGEVKYLYVAVADCTGHGVPGGFMSMLSIAYLNEIAGKDKYIKPAEILNQLREKVIKELGQTGKIGETKDGLDISLCCIKQGDNENVDVQWAGANNPLWIISNNEVRDLKVDIESKGLFLQEIKADKQPIGYFSDLAPFTNHAIEVDKGDTLIMFSDGFPDQFGGEKGKKFKYKPFKKLLLGINSESLTLQKGKLDETFEKWKGNLEQIDDVCIVGIKV